jgi:hypothetical protein
MFGLVLSLLVTWPGKAAQELTMKAPKDTVAFLRVRSLKALNDAWGRYGRLAIDRIDPGEATNDLSLLNDVGESIGNPELTGVAMGKPLGVALVMPTLNVPLVRFNMGPGDNEPEPIDPARILIYVPLADTEAFVDAVDEGDYFTKIDGAYAILAEDRADFELAESAGVVLPLPDEPVSLWVDVPHIERQLAPTLNEYKRLLAMVSMMSDNGNPIDQWNDWITQAQQTMRQVESLTATAAIANNNIRIVTTLRAKEGSDLADVLEGTEPGVPLHRFLPSEAFAMVEGVVPVELIDLYAMMLEMAVDFEADTPKGRRLADRLRAGRQKLVKAVGPGGLQVAAAMGSFDPQAPASVVGVARMSDPAQFRHATIDLIELDKLRDQHSDDQGEVYYTTTVHKADRRIAGVPIDRIEAARNAAKPGIPSSPSDPWCLIVPPEGERRNGFLTVVDNTLAWTAGRNADSAMKGIVGAFRRSPEPPARAPRYAAACMRLPRDRTMTGYLYPIEWARHVTAHDPTLFPKKARQRLHDLTPGKDPFSAALTIEGPRATLIVNLPAAAVNGFMQVQSLVDDAANPDTSETPNE